MTPVQDGKRLPSQGEISLAQIGSATHPAVHNAATSAFGRQSSPSGHTLRPIGSWRVHGQGTAGSIQRWGYRDHYHGAGTESAGRQLVHCPAVVGTGAAQLRNELHRRGRLLEQPSPHAPHQPPRLRKGAVGESACVVLVSLFHFTTAWMGENHFAASPTAAYGRCC